MRQAIEKKETGQALFINLHNTFRALDRKTLLRKVEKYGNRRKVQNLI